MLGNFSCFCCCLLTFFKITFSKNSFRNTTKQFWVHIRTDIRSFLIWVQTVCRGYWSEDDKSHHKQGKSNEYIKYVLSKYIMDHPSLIVSNWLEDPISQERVNFNHDKAIMCHRWTSLTETRNTVFFSMTFVACQGSILYFSFLFKC